MSNNNKELEDFLNNVPGLPPAPKSNNGPRARNSELDAMEILQQRLMQKQAGFGFGDPQQTGRVNMPTPVNRQTDQQIKLRPGFPFYKAVSNDVSHVNIAMKTGMTEQLVEKELLLGSQSNFLLVEGHNPIDLSNVNSTMLTAMVVVKTFWEGEFIVPEAAVVRIGKKQSQLLRG